MTLVFGWFRSSTEFRSDFPAKSTRAWQKWTHQQCRLTDWDHIQYLRSDSKSPNFSLRNFKNACSKKSTQTHKIKIACFIVCFQAMFYLLLACVWIVMGGRPEAAFHVSALQQNCADWSYKRFTKLLKKKKKPILLLVPDPTINTARRLYLNRYAI